MTSRLPSWCRRTEAFPQYLGTVDNAQRRADADTLVELMCDVTGEPAVVWGPSIVGFVADRRTRAHE